jgi:putative DNA primase/helicase
MHQPKLEASMGEFNCNHASRLNPIDLIQSGLALVPIPCREKGPTSRGWNLRENTITTSEGALLLAGKNIGLAHAFCTPTPTCAIDLDNYKESKKWLAKEGIDLDLWLFRPDATVAWSGKKNSLKLFYRLPQTVGILESKQVHGPDGKMMLEFRCAAKSGATMQDLLPPSVHPTGSHYQWLGDGSPLNIPEIPKDLLQIWLNLATAKRTGTRLERQSKGPCRDPQMLLRPPRLETPRQIAVVRELLSQISADCGRDLWRDIVWGILSTSWSCAVDIAKAWSQSAPTRYEDDAFWTLVQTYDANRTDGPTLGTLYYHARQGGLNG